MNAEILEGWGYRVTGHTESPAALQAFMDNPQGFDLVMTDLTMPKMTGLELARRIMAVRPDIPIVLMTGFSEATTLEKARLMGIREFLIKPAGSREWPAVSAASSPAKERSEPLARILVIDDEPQVRSLLERLLTREGYEVVSPPTATRASRLIARPRPIS
jgi:CheY-like chemotaxis protein